MRYVMDLTKALGKKAYRFVLLQKAGPFIGPRGGKWADPKHTIPWDAKKQGAQKRQGADKELARRILKKRPEELRSLHSDIVKYGGMGFGSEESYEEMNAGHALVALGLAEYSTYRSDERFAIKPTKMAWDEAAEAQKPIPGKGKTPEQWAKLPKDKTPKEHLKIAQQFIKQHDKDFPQALEQLKSLSGKGDVKGRVKTAESALGKLIRKPDYGTADKLQDGAGLRVVHQTVAEVNETVAKIKTQYKVIAEDDYISKPQGNYRSYHLIVEGPTGLPMEIQVRTANQNTFADWAHNVYKPVSDLQAKHRDDPEVQTYEKQMSDYFWAVDNSREPPPKPPCTVIIRSAFGCL